MVVYLGVFEKGWFSGLLGFGVDGGLFVIFFVVVGREGGVVELWGVFGRSGVFRDGGFFFDWGIGWVGRRIW